MNILETIRAELTKRLKNTRDYIRGAKNRNPLTYDKIPNVQKNMGKESAYDAILSLINTLQDDFIIIPKSHPDPVGEQGESGAFFNEKNKLASLTIEDIERIDIHLCAIRANKSGCFTFRKLSDEQYQEVLRKIAD